MREKADGGEPANRNLRENRVYSDLEDDVLRVINQLSYPHKVTRNVDGSSGCGIEGLSIASNEESIHNPPGVC